jgi:hypothetical protein
VRLWTGDCFFGTWQVRGQTVFRNVNSKWREKGKPDFRVQISEFRSEQEVGGKENEFSDFRVQF